MIFHMSNKLIGNMKIIRDITQQLQQILILMQINMFIIIMEFKIIILTMSIYSIHKDRKLLLILLIVKDRPAEIYIMNKQYKINKDKIINLLQMIRFSQKYKEKIINQIN